MIDMRGKLVFLGTSAGVPTGDRGLSSVALQWKGEVMLLDVGEGTQNNMIKAGISPMKVAKVFITHLHGDHVLGLPGLLMTMDLLGREDPLSVYGPTGLNAFLSCLLPTIYEDNVDFPVSSTEIVRPGLVVEGKDYRIFATRSRHSVESWAFKFEEKDRPGKFDEEVANRLGVPPGPLRTTLTKGKAVTVRDKTVEPEDVVGPPRPGFKIVYTGDTAFSEEVVGFSKGVDILIHEATFESSKAESAEKVMHALAADAAKVASMAGVRQLILTHISARYQNAEPLLEEARKTFKNVEVAQDLAEYVID
jgi:ribonuclease Z